MGSVYLKVFVDCLEKYQKLNDTEFGRFIRAALRYKATGEEVRLTGREELLWDGMKLDIDRDNVNYAVRVAANATNGKKGGRPKNPIKANESENNPLGFSETQKSQDKDKDKDKDKDDKDTSVISGVC
ncbi:MAG TPA: hypothetical protein DEQ02_05620 [Ruminococcaceae bacterium]|nr:hypothetical protein [Oscillospiraceae bacterium]